jgi:hypothetical protein
VKSPVRLLAPSEDGGRQGEERPQELRETLQAGMGGEGGDWPSAWQACGSRGDRLLSCLLSRRVGRLSLLGSGGRYVRCGGDSNARQGLSVKRPEESDLLSREPGQRRQRQDATCATHATYPREFHDQVIRLIPCTASALPGSSLSDNPTWPASRFGGFPCAWC